MSKLKLSRLQKAGFILFMLLLVLFVGLRLNERIQLRLEPEPARKVSPPAVEVVKVEPETFVQFRTYQGTVQAEDRAVISSRITGQVIKVIPEEGDKILRNELMVEIDKQELTKELDMLEAAGQRLRGELELAATRLARQRELYAKKITHQDALDASEQRYHSLQASVRENQANRELVLERLEYSEIKAPFSGVVQKKYVQQGELVTPGSPVIELISTHLLKAVFSIPQMDAPKIRPGLPVSFEYATVQGDRQASIIHSVYPALESGLRSMTATAFLETDDVILPGMSVDVRVEISRKPRAIMIPAQAIHRQGNNKWVFIVRNGHVLRKEVRTGPSRQGRVLVISGLDKGDIVVITPDQRLKDKDQVIVVNSRDKT